MITLAQAQEQLLGMAPPLGAESVAVTEAAGRYLAATAFAGRTQPAADLSAMDGYAMRHDDLAGPWRVAGESAAGHPYAAPLRPGESVRVSTGALLPLGAGAVLLQEDARRDGDTLHIGREAAPSPRHIRRAGFDFRAGDPLLEPGVLLDPASIALLLSGGHAMVEVGRRPALAILDSGDELSTNPESCAPHQIPASNGAMLAAMAAPLARSVRRIGPLPDRLDALLAGLTQAEGAGVLVTSGGASVGDHDLLRPALEQWGAEIAFWRVAMKPGKPVLVARRGSQIILGLPGNPVSSYVTAFLLLLPLLRRLGGACSDAVLPRRFCAVLEQTLPAIGARQEFVRGSFRDNKVAPLTEQDSSALRSLAAANVLIERQPHSQAAAPGEHVWCFLLE